MLVEVVQVFKDYYALILPAIFCAYFLSNKYQKGLNKYPGPILASFTDLWRFFVVWGRAPEKAHISLHRKHGDVVRLGPNVLSFGTAAALKDIYGLNKGFIKSDFYPIQQSVSGGKVLPSLFGTKDESYHARLRRCINGAFSMTSLIQYEPSVDNIIKLFLSQTEKLFVRDSSRPGIECDFARWLQFYAFDVIGAITYSKAHGFVERNEDVDGQIKYLAGFFDYVAIVGQIPFLDRLWQKNPILLYLNKFGIQSGTGTGTVKFAKARMAERFARPKDDIDPTAPSDLLNKFIAAKKDHPDIMNDQRVLTMSASMAFAGSETTGISLSALFYFLLKNPGCYEKVMKEIDEATLQDPQTVTFNEANQMKYLDACIKETFRLFPAAGLTMERIVPPQGATIAGRQIPGGTIVGCSGWVIHREKAVFGDNVDDFVPERWLDVEPEQLKVMSQSMVQFGMGARTCLGKNISLLEIYKLVPSFLRHFDVKLTHPDRDWRTHNAWFVRQLDFDVAIEKRQVA